MKITVEFKSGWILKHREEEELPVSYLVAAVAEDKEIACEEISFTICTFVSAKGESAVREAILSAFSKRYQDAAFSDVAEVEVTEIEGEGDGAPTADEPTDEEHIDRILDELDELSGALDGDADEEEEQKEEDDVRKEIDERRAEISALLQRALRSRDGGGETSSEEGSAAQGEQSDAPNPEFIMKEIDGLIGAEEFKTLAKEIALVAPELVKNHCVDIFTHQSYLFSINDGYGLSTYLKHFSDLLTALALREQKDGGLFSHASGVYEETLGAVKESMEPFDGALGYIRNAGGSLKVMCIDISEWMNHTDSRFFKEFLRVLEGAMDKFIFVFRIPFVEKDVLERIRASLCDLLSVRAVTFPPMTKDEIQRYAKSKIEQYGFSIKSAAWESFHQRISEEKSDGKFYGINTVQKVVRDLIYHKYLSNARTGADNKVIGKRDAKSLVASYGGELTGTQMLEKLVGNEAIKQKIEEIIAQIEVSVRNKEERPCIHMRFLGNPGTGKTTVARIIGKILKERGVLRIGNFHEYAGRDFCGRYIGETAPKTASICRDAYGSVLFIDEAYSLYRGDDNSRDYGREALDTLIAEMENHRSDFVVIMAGYSDDMNTLMEGNVGLKSRMPYEIDFPNFTREQLGDIYLTMLNDKFKYEKSVVGAVREYFNAIPEETLSSKEFANARFVRNLFERTWAKAAMRCQLAKQKNIVITKDDFERSIVEGEFALFDKKKTRLGF